VKIRQLHGWQLTTTEARDLQLRLAAQVVRTGGSTPPRLVAGVDMAARRDGTARSAVVVLTFPQLELVETRVAEGILTFPNVPGLLTFREAPLILAACDQLTLTPDLVLVDGQGIAHPRRFGIAAHLGLLLDLPTIGCAKSRLIGIHDDPGHDGGSKADLVDDGEVIGAVLRTKNGTRPVYVSIGHKIDLGTAVQRVLECCRGYRLPQPTRLAHLAAGGRLFQAAIAA